MGISDPIKRAAAHLPHAWRQELKRIHFARQIRRNRFASDEVEFGMLDAWLGPGRWAIDIGANVGLYTRRMSDLVGPEGRILAFEPVPATFELLSANVNRFQFANVSLFNMAASDSSGVVNMQMPKFSSGLDNYYQAHITDGAQGLPVLTMPLDSLTLPARVSLIKIDAEGHEMSVLRGMTELIRRDSPTIVMEYTAEEPGRFLTGLGYQARYIDQSSNQIFQRDATKANPAP